MITLDEILVAVRSSAFNAPRVQMITELLISSVAPFSAPFELCHRRPLVI